MEIRKDMASVAQYLERLLVYAKVFATNNNKHWSHLKNKEDYYNIYNLADEVRKAFEKIYSSGRDLAIYMSYKLQAFNYADEFPTLTSYVESFRDGWLDEMDELQKTSENAKEKGKGIENCPWAVEQMIVLFDDQLRLLLSVQQCLDILRNTDLYRIENGELPMAKDTRTIHVSNVSGRVNINSQDHSINTAITTANNIINQIKEAIDEAEMSEREKGVLLNNLEDLEASIGSESYVQKYQKFVQSAANHMTILAPFLPALTNLLG